jgi:Transposase DNA-binding/Transposase Tn5 dimerisation domain/Transposase DDE domain
MGSLTIRSELARANCDWWRNTSGLCFDEEGTGMESRYQGFCQRSDAMQDWVEQELETSDMGDERLDDRFRVLADCLSQRPSVSIPTACGGTAEMTAAYRFFANERIEAPGVLRPHRQATLQRIQAERVVLLIQDTTEIEVTRPEQQMKGAGPLNDESHWGFYNHVSLAVTPERVPLGVVEANIWARDVDEFRENKRLSKQAKEQKRKQTPIEAKESYRWLEGYRLACTVAAQTPDSLIVSISDSEGDIYDCFAEAAPEKGTRKAEWIVRACQNRSLPWSAGAGPGYQKLWDELSQTKVLETCQVDVSKNRPQSHDDRKRKQPRSARTATVTIQAKRVTLKAPWRPDAELRDVEVNAILVREVNPPKGEEPIEWLLLTSLPIDKIKKVRRVLEYYGCRWQIEVYFRVLKSGCKVEDRQFESDDHYLPCLALYMVIAWRVLYVMMLGRTCPDMSCGELFSEAEWKAVYTVVRREPAPETAPTLHEMIALIGRLGGHMGRSHDGPPGPKAMWIGMQRMMDLASAWEAFGPPSQTTKKRKKCVNG